MYAYAVSFRHLTPGEGVAGTEWDFVPGAARQRVAEFLADPSYEVAERTFYIPNPPADLDEITERIDDHFWQDFGGGYTEPVTLDGWEA